MVAAFEGAPSEIGIRHGGPRDAFDLAEQITELGGAAGRYSLATYQQRLGGAAALVLLACHGDAPVGFKAGYDRFRDGSWYSWMGGVLTPWRGRGVAQRLLEAQEAWVIERGYDTLYVKTRNRHKRMLAFLARNDYDVVRLEEKGQPADTRILLCKRLPSRE